MIIIRQLGRVGRAYKVIGPERRLFDIGFPSAGCVHTDTHRHTPTHTHTYTLIEHMWVLTEIYKFSTDGYLTAIVFPLVSSGTRKILIHRVVVLIHRCFHSVLSRHLHPMFAEMITMLSYYCKFLAFLPTIFLPLTSIILLQRYFQKTATSIR